MLGRTWLSGTERRSIEITGRLDPARARALVPPTLALREEPGGAEVELLAFRMSGLAPIGLPWIGMDYGEVLFRLGVEWRGEPAWFVAFCALDRPAVALAAAALMRYPRRRADRITLDATPALWQLSASDRGTELLRATLTPDSGPLPPLRPVRPVLVRAGKSVLRVPWEETPAPERRRARVTLEPGALEKEALGEHATWTGALLHEGRLHRCGVAGS